MALCKKSRSYWENYVNDVEISDHQLGSKSFFLDMYQYRYTADRMGYLLHEIQALAKEFPGGRVLEIGCGPGTDLRQLSTAGFQTVAVDMTYNGIRLAQQHLSKFGQTAQLVLGNAERLPFDDSSFDCAWSAGVLHHVDDTHVAIDELHRVLRPGGRAVVVLYHKWSWLNFFSKIFQVPVEHAEKDAPIIKTYSVGEVRRLFHRFREVEVYVERPPRPVKKTRTGLKALLFNKVLCPCFNLLPNHWGKAIGWHLVIRGMKVVTWGACWGSYCMEI
ncbi:MAG: hypothetical protein BWK76_15230 [Desulfobulbaceae bacterium A2]|nr:MAG: hypothetical protein BWK76_15230 [Desulfobulbaceae bacterium A2]